MIPWVDFNPNAVYCGNVAASSIKMALVIAAMYKLVMRGGDLVRAYLVTQANPDFPVHIQTPQGYEISKGMCIRAVGNLYGLPPAGQNFSKEFDKCLRECDYNNTPWDEQKIKCFKYPYRKVVGQLMYGMVHTMVTIMYALNTIR
jgi:hypothetical protein